LSNDRATPPSTRGARISPEIRRMPRAAHGGFDACAKKTPRARNNPQRAHRSRFDFTRSV
jgi:hypothetical protein